MNRAKSSLMGLAAAGLSLLLASGQPAAAAPPVTTEHDVIESYHGITVHDPYRWLEQAAAPAVQQWIDAQNAYTDGVMSRFSDHGAIIKRVGELAVTSTQRSSPKIVASRLFYLRQTPPQPQAVLVVQAWPDGDAKVLVDTNATKGDTAITNYWPSPDGSMVAYGVAQGGTENTTIRFVNVANGRVASDALPYAGGGTTPQALAWDADGKGVTYVRLPLPGTVPSARAQFNAQLYHHALGTPASGDTAALGKMPSPIAEYQLITSAHGDHAAAFVYFGDANFESVYLRSGSTWRKVLDSSEKVRVSTSETVGAAWAADRLLMSSYLRAPRAQLLALESDGRTHIAVPQQTWAINGVASIKGGLLLVEVSGPDWRIRQFSSDGKPIRTVPLPSTGIGINAVAATEDSSIALIAYSGWSIPSRWVKYDATSGALTPVFEVKPTGDYSKVRIWRLDAPSTGGIHVPVTVMALGDTRPDGSRPTILSAYGGYGRSRQPTFLGPMLAWLQRGGVYAYANIRGGGEYGDAWHQDGSRGNKQHCFDDLHAAARALIDAHWTNSAHLGIYGGSNGGLLMGAALTQHPADYRAVVSVVGIYDMLRSELWPNGEYNTYEFGTVTKPDELAWLYAYSPLHHVRTGTAYPAVLLITGENDPRVAPYQSRKFAAALQKANSSKRPILLITRRNEGHGVTSSFSQRVGNTGAELSFFAEELGLAPARTADP
ncbi:MAG TPA: prolyl oligopeptidase family serine peptidase [Steroidobacteraceae bacterium]|nr:prolyl oligopeptidase family serine peptidase [Steroidobacteraceae bacterium]